jgi:hypothetical protein
MKITKNRLSAISLFLLVILYSILSFPTLAVSLDVYSQSTTKEDLFNELNGKEKLKVQPPTDPQQDKMDVLHCLHELSSCGRGVHSP